MSKANLHILPPYNDFVILAKIGGLPQMPKELQHARERIDEEIAKGFTEDQGKELSYEVRINYSA